MSSVLSCVIAQSCPTAFWRAEGVCLLLNSQIYYIFCVVSKKRQNKTILSLLLRSGSLLTDSADEYPASGRFLPVSSSVSPLPLQTPNDVGITNFPESVSKLATFTFYILKIDWDYNSLESHIEKWFSLIYGHTFFLPKTNVIQPNSQTLALIFGNSYVQNSNILSRLKLCHHWGY